MSKLVRFSISIPEDLAKELDSLASKRGTSKNRSEVIRDLIREEISQGETSNSNASVMGTLTILYNHHKSDLQDKLHDIQHDYCENIVSTTHVHVDPHTCLEVIILRGKNEIVQEISNKIKGTKGVDLGKLVLTQIGNPHHHHKETHSHE